MDIDNFAVMKTIRKDNNPSNIILKITFTKQIKSLSSCFIYSFLYLGGIIYFLKYVNFSMNEKGAWVTIILIFFLFLLIYGLTLFFHLDYFKRNKQKEYEIGNREIIIKDKNTQEKKYNFNEIESITLYLTPAEFYKYGWRHTRAYDDYHFAKIVMKSGEKIYLTSLLYPSGIEKILKKYMKNVPYSRVKRWFPSTLW
jgi:hypothetical protein